MSTLTETLKSNLDSPASSAVEFDLHAALDEVLGGVGLTASDSGGKITFYGKDPIVVDVIEEKVLLSILISH